MAGRCSSGGRNWGTSPSLSETLTERSDGCPTEVVVPSLFGVTSFDKSQRAPDPGRMPTRSIPEGLQGAVADP